MKKNYVSKAAPSVDVPRLVRCSSSGDSNDSLLRGPRFEVSIDKRGGSVAATGAAITSSRVVGIFDGPSGGIAGSLSVNPRSFVAINVVVGEDAHLGVSGNANIPRGIGYTGLLHVSINLGDDFGVGHEIDLVLDISSTNVQAHPRRELKPEFKKDVTRRWMERLVRFSSFVGRCVLMGIVTLIFVLLVSGIAGIAIGLLEAVLGIP